MKKLVTSYDSRKRTIVEAMKKKFGASKITNLYEENGVFFADALVSAGNRKFNRLGEVQMTAAEIGGNALDLPPLKYRHLFKTPHGNFSKTDDREYGFVVVGNYVETDDRIERTVREKLKTFAECLKETEQKIADYRAGKTPRDPYGFGADGLAREERWAERLLADIAKGEAGLIAEKKAERDHLADNARMRPVEFFATREEAEAYVAARLKDYQRAEIFPVSKRSIV